MRSLCPRLHSAVAVVINTAVHDEIVTARSDALTTRPLRPPSSLNRPIPYIIYCIECHKELSYRPIMSHNKTKAGL